MHLPAGTWVPRVHQDGPCD